MQLLRQDQPALHRALDQAGLPADGRIVVVQQASTDAGGQRQPSPGSGGAATDGGTGDGAGRGGQGWSGSGGNGGATQDQARRQDAWLRAGVDITA